MSENAAPIPASALPQTGSAQTRALDADLVADIAHELRTPLGGIDAMAELLQGLATTVEQTKLIEGLLAASRHLRAIAGHLIDGDAAAVSTHTLNPEPIAIDTLLDGVVISARARARSKKLNFEVLIDPSMPGRVMLDPRRTRQMLENLIDNAIKVMTRGTVKLLVDMKNQQVRFAVRDEGPGFKPGDFDRLFQRRMQVDTGPKGTGIGLSLVKRYADAAGGECGALNLPESGAEIWFSLPLSTQAETRVSGGAGRALVVEDSFAGSLLMRTMLEHFGFSVVIASGGTKAIEAARQEKFDLITVDRTLGDSDGVDVVRQIRDWLGRDSQTRIIAVTGRVDEKDRIAFSMAGVDGFLPKPLSPRALSDILTRLKFLTAAPVRSSAA